MSNGLACFVAITICYLTCYRSCRDNDEDSKKTNERVLQDRFHQIDAAIVRIMKVGTAAGCQAGGWAAQCMDTGFVIPRKPCAQFNRLWSIFP